MSITPELLQSVLSGHRCVKHKDVGAFINIHELASMCEDWALDRDYVITAFTDHCGTGFASVSSGVFGFRMNQPLGAKNKNEAIFRAAQWILDLDSESAKTSKD